MKVETVPGRAEGGLRIVVDGDLDLDSSPLLLEAIRQALKHAPVIELYLGDVEYIDSSGIAVLVHGYKLATKRSVRYELVNPSLQVMSVIELSQLQKFFTIRTSEEAG